MKSKQFFFEVIFYFEKEVTSVYRNYSLRNSRNSYLSVKVARVVKIKLYFLWTDFIMKVMQYPI